MPGLTGIADLIGAFSAFGPIGFASVGPPAVVSFETEAAAAQALLVASMKSVSLLGAFREKKLLVPAPVQPAASRNQPSPSSALGVSSERDITSNDLAASQRNMSPIEAAPPAETMTSPIEVQPPVREKKLQVPPPVQPATCCNQPSSGASMASAKEDTVGSVTGRLNSAPCEERRLPLLRDDEEIRAIVAASLFTILLNFIIIMAFGDF